MIVEGYCLDVYCNGKHRDWELMRTATASFFATNKRNAWREARAAGWRLGRTKAYCPACARASK